MNMEQLAESIAEYCRQEQDASIEFLRYLVNTNSWSKNPRGIEQVTALLVPKLRSLGFDTVLIPHEDSRYGPHLVAGNNLSVPGDILLVSHLDTVYSSREEEAAGFSWRRDGGKIYGPGVCDIHGGTAVMLLALDALKQFLPDHFHGINIVAAWNSSEEENSDHFSRVLKRYTGEQTVCAAVFEAGAREGGQDILVSARKGRAVFSMTARGTGGHAGTSHEGSVNAIVELARFIPSLAALTDYSRGVTVNPGIISGGRGINRIPEDARLDFEIRSYFRDDLERSRSELESMTGESFCRVEMERSVEPWEPNQSSENLTDVWRQAGALLGMSVTSGSRGGLSDGNYTWRDIPTLDGLGPLGFNAHVSGIDGSEPEYIEEDSLWQRSTLGRL